MTNTIGIRDAKAELSRLLREVKQGAEWIITERGTPIAKLGPIPQDERTLNQRILALEERGLIERVTSPLRKLPPPLPQPGNVAQRWLQEDRGR